MLKRRIISALVGLPFLVAAVWFGAPWFTILIAAMAAIGSFEFYKMVSNISLQPLGFFGIFWTILFVASRHCPYPYTTPLLITTALIIPAIWMLARPPREKALINWALTVVGIFYTGWMLSLWVDLRGLEDGREWVFFGLLSTFTNDTCAFFCGRTWGTRPLAPSVSPAKTWQGAISGAVVTIVVSMLLKFILQLSPSYWQIALFGCLISIFAQLGDLVESLLKRNVGVKDSGIFLPGHGGILDRVDSLIFTGAIVYYGVTFFNW